MVSTIVLFLLPEVLFLLQRSFSQNKLYLVTKFIGGFCCKVFYFIPIEAIGIVLSKQNRLFFYCSSSGAIYGVVFLYLEPKSWS